MDARSIEEAAGMPLGMINTWISKGFIREARPSGRGRRRDFDLQSAIQIGVAAELSRLKIPTGMAAAIVDSMKDYGIVLLTPYPREQDLSGDDPVTEGVRNYVRERSGLRDMPMAAFFRDEDGLFENLKTHRRKPASFAVVNIAVIRENMRRAEQEWQARNAATG